MRLFQTTWDKIRALMKGWNSDVLTISKPLSAGQAQTYHQKEFTAKEQSYWSQGNAVEGEWQGRAFTLVDTGGIGLLRREKSEDIITKAALEQVQIAIEAAHVIILVVNVRDGAVIGGAHHAHHALVFDELAHALTALRGANLVDVRGQLRYGKPCRLRIVSDVECSGVRQPVAHTDRLRLLVEAEREPCAFAACG